MPSLSKWNWTKLHYYVYQMNIPAAEFLVVPINILIIHINNALELSHREICYD